MKTSAKLLVLAALAAAVAVAVLAKNRQTTVSTSQTAVAVRGATPQHVTPSAPVPKLLDLGAGKCVPCKMMAPILEQLKTEYVGRMDVEFIDVWQNPDAGRAFSIDIIPTQIFYDAEGKELFRHTGFFGKEDILNKWKELGIHFEAPVVEGK